MSPPAATGRARLLDVLIVGAGPAGCATALALLRAGVQDVALVTPPASTAWRLSESATPDVPALLAQLGVRMPPGHHPYLGNLSAWGEPMRQDDFVRRGHPPGWLVDRKRFDDQLREATVAAGSELLQPFRLREAVRIRNGWSVTLQPVASTRPPGPPVTLQTRLLVDASGRRAALARGQLGARRQRIDDQVALAARIPGARPARIDDLLAGRVLVEAVPCGWWYASAPPDGPMMLSLMTDMDLARNLRTPTAWREALDHTQVLQALGVPPSDTGQAPPAIRTFAAQSGCLDRIAGPGWLAVGDALMSLDPLTSSGLSGALRDGIAAASEVLLPWLEGASPGTAGRAWGRRANHVWQRFLVERRARYAMVSDWRTSRYWRRRQSEYEASASRILR
ncbi:MAG: FAD-dependent monooxygenase [Verrucomicrobiae bacterium]|nr:FAD-dependent monooxygenase [Verrucomicrobiae bacterium]